MAKVFRIVLLTAVVGAMFLLGAGTLLAADGDWPGYTLTKDFRGPGCYLSIWKMLATWLVFLLWVYTTDWVSTDAQELKLNYLRWNPIVFGTFMAAMVLVWVIPNFWIGLFLLVVAYVAPLATYVVMRNKTVTNDKRVMTAEHLRYWFATKLNKIGFKIAAERKDPREAGAPVKLVACDGPDERTDTARLMMARQSPGFFAAREILVEGFAGRASAIMLDYTQQGVAVRIMVDGMWIPREPKPRDVGDPALEALKLLCGLNPKDRQSRQAGVFAADYESSRFKGAFTSQGTPGGERVVLQFEDKKIRLKTLDELGMRTKLQEQLIELIGKKEGFSLLSAPPAGGLRTTTDVVLHACDRYTREFAAVEEETHPYIPVENIPVTTYKAADGQTPVDVLPRLFRTEPNVVVVRDLINGETVTMMCDEAEEDHRMMIGTVRAKDCVEALLRVLALDVAPAKFADKTVVVLNQRLVRKLCEGCKEAYTPPPQVLKQLGIPAGRVQAFYRPRQPNPEEPKEPCEICGGLGYFGRTAIFEILPVGDAVRKAMVGGAVPEAMRQAARKDGMKTLQEEGILLVVKGVTSLPELMRVLK
jgi:type II secretory ATPase GspE/PulE/Tfp pilus assembly ATPase PilB-like protein